MLKHQDSQTQVLDAQRKIVMPGFIDSHNHFIVGDQSTLALQQAGYTSLNNMPDVEVGTVAFCMVFRSIYYDTSNYAGVMVNSETDAVGMQIFIHTICIEHAQHVITADIPRFRGPEQCIAVEHIKELIVVGKFADFVIPDHDLLTL
ncbi:hypothetical protein I4U23_023240 [Adineta vaga]|nr:hypothetical protein I4U23_023240 [Adineta vaga]